MELYIDWLGIFSIVTFLLAIIARTLEYKKIKSMSVEALQKQKKNIFILQNHFDNSFIRFSDARRKDPFISAYNFLTILELLPFFKKVAISSNNHFVKAYMHDYENRISSQNLLVHSSIPCKLEKSMRKANEG